MDSRTRYRLSVPCVHFPLCAALLPPRCTGSWIDADFGIATGASAHECCKRRAGLTQASVLSHSAGLEVVGLHHEVLQVQHRSFESLT